jgi:hypothetical protein
MGSQAQQPIHVNSTIPPLLFIFYVTGISSGEVENFKIPPPTWPKYAHKKNIK